MAIFEAVLPVALQLVGMALTYFNASQATVAAFESLVEASKNDGLISEETSNVFDAQVAALKTKAASRPPKAQA